MMDPRTNISAKIIADSISQRGDRIITMQLHYPRFIHAEFMTHRLFSRNASSSRAIPVSSIINIIKQNPALPIYWGRNQAGMKAKEELDPVLRERAIAFWLEARNQAIEFSERLQNLELHKQTANRITEPFQHMNVIVTSTEWRNFLWLRDHEDAQPEIRDLAVKIKNAIRASSAKVLHDGEWHLPFIEKQGRKFFADGAELTFEQALKVSASACAQVSYRKNDLSLEKAEKIWDMLIFSSPCHASPVEHQATPMPLDVNFNVEGVTSLDKLGNFWSGNFKGWIQHRKLIENESVW